MQSRRASALSFVLALGVVATLTGCSFLPGRAPLPADTKVLENPSAEDIAQYQYLLAITPKSWKVSRPKDIKEVQGAFPGAMIPRYTAGRKPVGIILTRAPFSYGAPMWTLTLCYEKGVWASAEVYPASGPMDDGRLRMDGWSGETTSVGDASGWVGTHTDEGTSTAMAQWSRGRVWYTAGGVRLSAEEALKIARSMAP